MKKKAKNNSDTQNYSSLAREKKFTLFLHTSLTILKFFCK